MLVCYIVWRIILCRQSTLLPIVPVQKKNAHATENVKNVSNITQKMAKSPTVQDNWLESTFFQFC